jgi:hypothetical protein
LSVALFKAIVAKNITFRRRWRAVQIYELPAWAKGDIEASRLVELKRLDDEIAAQESKINALRLPKPHIWTLQPAA